MYDAICSLAARLAGSDQGHGSSSDRLRQHLVRRAYALLLDMDEKEGDRVRRDTYSPDIRASVARP